MALDLLWKHRSLNISQEETSTDISLVYGTVRIGDMDAEGKGQEKATRLWSDSVPTAAAAELDGPSDQCVNTRRTTARGTAVEDSPEVQVTVLQSRPCKKFVHRNTGRKNWREGETRKTQKMDGWH